MLLPWSLSASHVAFLSIRMEPVLMTLGQAAATAACLALDGNQSVQNVSYPELRKRLLADKQTLETKRRKQIPHFVDPKKLAGIVIDDLEVRGMQDWPCSGSKRYQSKFRYVPGLAFGREGEYLTDRLTDEALKIIDRAEREPFFVFGSLCLSYSA